MITAMVRETITGILAMGVLPANMPKSKISRWVSENALFYKYGHVTVDREQEMIYAGAKTIVRFDGNTGEFDTTWFGDRGLDKASEFYFAHDGMLYARCGQRHRSLRS